MTETTVQENAGGESFAAQAGQVGEDLGVSIRKLIDAGVHFGHQTNRWNPKMAQYIYGARNGIHIVDLDQTAKYLKRALNFVTNAVGRGGQLLFVGTKRQAQDVIVEEATRSGQFHVTGRWLGGTLTNFRTMKVGIERLRQLSAMDEDGTLDTLAKKEALLLRREAERLTKFVGGIRDMNGPPAALFVIDPQHEHIAVDEANKLGIPVVGLTDTNCDPDLIQYVIPGNDDAIRSIKLITNAIAEASIQGQSRRREFAHSGRDQGPGPSVEFSRGRGRGERSDRGGGGRGERSDRGGERAAAPAPDRVEAEAPSQVETQE
jgi:small subunit ribosomal protein S2